MFVIPLTASPNQTFSCTVPIDGVNRPLSFNLRYNSIAGYWNLTVIDTREKAALIDSLPLMTGEFPAANLLEQFSYMGLGSAAIVRDGEQGGGDGPDGDNLGSEYLLVWGDSV